MQVTHIERGRSFDRLTGFESRDRVRSRCVVHERLTIACGRLKIPLRGGPVPSPSAPNTRTSLPLLSRLHGSRLHVRHSHSCRPSPALLFLLPGEPVSFHFLAPLRLAVWTLLYSAGGSASLTFPFLANGWTSSSRRTDVSPCQKRMGRSADAHTCWYPQCLLRISAGLR